VLSIRAAGGRVSVGGTRWEFIMGILESPCVKGIVQWATSAIRRCVLIGDTREGVFQLRGR